MVIVFDPFLVPIGELVYRFICLNDSLHALSHQFIVCPWLKLFYKIVQVVSFVHVANLQHQNTMHLDEVSEVSSVPQIMQSISCLPFNV